MPFWVVVTNGDLLGPYDLSERAEEHMSNVESVTDEPLWTVARRRSEAVRELRHQLVERLGPEWGRKNFKRKGEV